MARRSCAHLVGQARRLSVFPGYCPVMARTVQGMARVRPGRLLPDPYLLVRSVRRGSRVKRDFACTCTRHLSPVLVVLRSQSRLRLEGRTRTLSGPSPDLSPARLLHLPPAASPFSQTALSAWESDRSRPIRPAEQPTSGTVSSRECPLMTLVNCTLIARRPSVFQTSCHCRDARGWMKLEAAPPADVVTPWRCVPVFQTDAGARPVGTPDCCCERVSQDLDLVAGSAGGAPVSIIGGRQEAGHGDRLSAGRRCRCAQEGRLGGGADAR